MKGLVQKTPMQSKRKSQLQVIFKQIMLKQKKAAVGYYFFVCVLFGFLDSSEQYLTIIQNEAIRQHYLFQLNPLLGISCLIRLMIPRSFLIFLQILSICMILPMQTFQRQLHRESFHI